MKKLLFYLGLILLFATCQNNEEIWQNKQTGGNSKVTIKLSPIEAVYGDIESRAVDDYTGETIQDLLYRLQYIITDESGNFIARDTLTTEELADFQSLELSLGMGNYKFYMLGEGLNTSFSHTAEELREVNTTNDIWYHNIRFQPIRREVFYAQREFTVDGSGTNIDFTVELKRQVGMLDIVVESTDEHFKNLGLTIMIPDAYAANYMTVDGQFGFDINDSNGTGWYWTKNIGYGNVSILPEDESIVGEDGETIEKYIYRARFFMFPTLNNYEGENTPHIIFSYLLGENGDMYNKDISLEGLTIEPNRVTNITLTVE